MDILNFQYANSSNTSTLIFHPPALVFVLQEAVLHVFWHVELGCPVGAVAAAFAAENGIND
jgi:hypothetical protein